jgi:hypothetical protein
MLRVPVNSASIVSVGYDRERRELEVEFRPSAATSRYPRGATYRYFDVPEEEHRAFMAAESKGTYLNQVFKPRGYRYSIVRKGKELIR